MNAQPATSRSQIAKQLRDFRESTGRKIAEVASELGWSESKVSRVETGQSNISSPDIRRLLSIYGVPKAEAERLVALNEEPNYPTWVDGYRHVLPKAYQTYLRNEATAERILIAELSAVSGLLQTPEYARAAKAATFTASQARLLNDRIAAEMARQSLLARDPGVELKIVMDEAALRRRVGDSGVMYRQMLRIIEISQHPSVSVQVLPFSTGARAGIENSFSIIEFDAGGRTEDAVFCPTLNGGLFFTQESDVKIFQEGFGRLASAALSASDSRTFISEVAERIIQADI